MMRLSAKHALVGSGFGAIQAGLFLHKVLLSGSLRRLVVDEVIPEVVTALRRAAGPTGCGQ